MPRGEGSIKLDIEYVGTELLVPYANNAKIHDAEQVGQIASSIERFGFSDPVGVWTNSAGELEIVEGHGRVLAAKRLGMPEVPIVRLDHMTDDERRAYAHVHNQTTLTSGFDDDVLFKDISSLDFDWGSFGFDITEIESKARTLDDVEEVPLPEDAEYRTRLGDIWALGRHRLICGDSTDAGVYARLMGGELAELVITDPPYNISYEGGTDDKLTIKNDSMPHDAFCAFLDNAFSAMATAMAPGAYFYVWHSDTERVAFQNALESHGMKVRQQLVWVKNTFTIGRQDYQWRHEPALVGWKEGAAHYFIDSRREGTVIDGEQPDFDSMSEDEMRKVLKYMYGEMPSTLLYYDKPLRNGDHPTMKPIKLIARLMRNSSHAGGIVLDPFGGSGTTLLAAEQWNRRCMMVELDERYCDVIIRRWEDFTGLKAELVERIDADVREGESVASR